MVEGPSTPTWGGDERTVFVARKVLATYPNLQGGTKFDKAFGSILDKLEQFYHSPVTTALADVDSSASAVNLCPTTCAAEGVPCLQ